MKCPVCDSIENKISRTRRKDDHVYRSRGCHNCDHPWGTYEILKRRVYEVPKY
ncbi:hypothetical protein [Halobacillus locisalis]|uniref:NrdR family transcriptional regulator n=1 Tax=Halobacillus locisalis TaxID=220753 RepID=UPI003CCCAE0D